MSACATKSLPADERASDEQCPVLSGVYAEEGTSAIVIDGESCPPFVAHLSSLTVRDSHLTPIAALRISHPASGYFLVEAFDANNRSLGAFPHGPEEGWQCSGGAFTSNYASTLGREGRWMDAASTIKIYGARDSWLVITMHGEYQFRSEVGPVGDKHVTDEEFRFRRTSLAH